MITQDFLQNYLSYKDGELIWKQSVGVMAKKGTIAGTVTDKGYKSICILGKIYKAHRIIFFYHHGYFPKVVDHIDGNKLNNKIENLRAATVAENSRNSKKRNNNKSGIKGVSWDKKSKKWRASCSVNYKQYNLGCFSSLEEAKNVVVQFRTEQHKEFSKHE